MNWHRVRASAAIAVAASVSCGCAMYSPNRDKQGQDVQKAWSQVDLTSQIEVPRKNLSALLDKQLALEDQIWQQRRDDAARQMVSSMSVAAFRRTVDERLLAISGSSNDTTTIASASSEKRLAQELLDSERGSLAIAGITAPSCATVLDAKKSAAFRGKFAKPDNNLKVQLWDGMRTDYSSNCIKLADAARKLLSLGGAIEDARAELARAQAGVDTQKQSIDKLAKELTDAQAEYQSQVDADTAKPGAAQTELSNAISKLEAAQSKVNSNSFAKSLISQKRLDALQGFLATYDDIESGKGVAAGSNQVAIALALFPDLAAKARQTLKDVDKPNLVPLVIQKNIEQQKLEESQRDCARQEQLVELLQAQVENLLAQQKAYSDVKRGLDGVWNSTSETTKLRDALLPYPADAHPEVRTRKEKTWGAAARYLDAEGRLHADYAKNRYRINALSYEETLTVAESGINQWKVLIDPSVELLAEFGADGTKTSDIKGLIDTLMLLGIAIGVN